MYESYWKLGIFQPAILVYQRGVRPLGTWAFFLKGSNSPPNDVSENSGTPKSSVLIGFSIINHPFWGTPIFGNPQPIFSRCSDWNLGGGWAPGKLRWNFVEFPAEMNMENIQFFHGVKLLIEVIIPVFSLDPGPTLYHKTRWKFQAQDLPTYLPSP